MASSTHFIGDYFTGIISIRKFKEGKNLNSVIQPELPQIIERTVNKTLHSINPNINFSNLVDKMKDDREVNFNQDALDLPCVVPMYVSDDTELKILDETMKNDLSQIMPTIMNTPPPSFIPIENVVPSEPLLITMTFYHPYDWLMTHGTNKGVKPNWKDSIQFHDGQTLADVRRAFVCKSMKINTDGNVGQQNPHKLLENLGNNDLIHDFFYINNSIYVDSQPDKITKDHYVIMQKWAQNQGHKMEKVLSQEIQLLDMDVCFGEPYIFLHLTGCEHLIVFNDVKFSEPNSSLDCYPKIIDIQTKK